MTMRKRPSLLAPGPLTIGITGHDLEGKRGGPGRWVFELCRQLNDVMPEARFIIYSRHPVEMPAISERWKNRVDPFPLVGWLKDPLWLVSRVGSLCRHDRPDVLWSTAPLLPRLGSGIRTIATVHDLKQSILSHQISWQGRLFYRLTFEASLKSAHAIVCLSHGTAQRLLSHYRLKASAVVQAAVSEAFRPASPEVVRTLLDNRGIRRPYILTVASGDKNKNLPALFAAFQNLGRQGHLTRYTLIVAGKRSPNVIAGTPRGSEPAIVPIGFVPDEELPALYTGAELFVLPSLYEGFGIPVLEARSCGTRVLTTDIPELREAGGDNALYCAPTPDGLQTGLLEALKRPRSGIAPDTGYSWNKSARVLAALLRGEQSDAKPLQ